MINMDVVSSEMIAARPFYRIVNPSWSNVLVGRAKTIMNVVEYGLNARRIRKSGAGAAEVIGDAIGYAAVRKIRRPLKYKVIIPLHKSAADIPRRDIFRKNGMGGRSWYNSPGRHEMVIVFHDANRVGPHIDVHVGRMSVVYRVKPDLYAKLKYTRDGMLTEDSRKLIIAHVQSEIQNGSRVPQNLDHSLSNARAGWTNGPTIEQPGGKAYGSGPTRQVVSISTIDVYKAHRNGPIEMYAPQLNPHRALYMYRLYEGDDKRAPILIWGAKSAKPPKLDDRLHLKMMDPTNMDAVAAKVDMSTATAKYDGSSCYVVITNKGTTVWSPRTSVKTGEQIEYTHKLDGLASLHSDETIVAMGELLFREKPKYPWQKSGDYLSSAQGSGILNSNSVLPKNINPEIRLYRVDRIGTTRTGGLNFWDNRLLQEQVAALDPRLAVVDLMDCVEAERVGFEGIVAVPFDASVNEGIKIKWTMDPHDWRIDSIEFKPGDKGGMAGVVWATSLESGKRFKLGPGQVGDRTLTTHMMNNPDSYVGSVLKVTSRRGHEGRASKVIGFHDDKGTFHGVEEVVTTT